MKILISYLATLFSLLIVDFVWLSFVAQKFYEKHMSFLFTKPINILPVIFFYPIYALSILILITIPSTGTQSWYSVALKGLFLGIAAYGAYDLTNHATIAKWPLKMTLVDMTWGAVLTILISLISFFVYKNIKF